MPRNVTPCASIEVPDVPSDVPGQPGRAIMVSQMATTRASKDGPGPWAQGARKGTPRHTERVTWGWEGALGTPGRWQGIARGQGQGHSEFWGHQGTPGRSGHRIFRGHAVTQVLGGPHLLEGRLGGVPLRGRKRRRRGQSPQTCLQLLQALQDGQTELGLCERGGLGVSGAPWQPEHPDPKLRHPTG